MIPEKTLEIIREEAAAWSALYEKSHEEVAYIAFLKAGQRGYELAMGDRWIDVKDELPEVREWLLVYNVYNGKIILAALTQYRQESLFHWRDVEDNKIIGVTHWQPLPSPPKPKP